MKRGLLTVLVVVAIAAVAQLLLGDDSIEPRVLVPRPVATIGSGSEAIAVGANGAAVRWLPLPEDLPLPTLPLAEVPKGGRFAGPMLQQIRVLAAAPAALRPYLASSSYGEGGVDVELTSGIEVRFGDASEAARKWRSAAAVLADPEISALDYVNVQSPRRPTVGGSGHLLPAAP
jgi:hypothetical protein